MRVFMLVLNSKKDETILIDNRIIVKVISTSSKEVR
jgi:sRNA-binding carbon storage regulator CsrA